MADITDRVRTAVLAGAGAALAGAIAYWLGIDLVTSLGIGAPVAACVGFRIPPRALRDGGIGATTLMASVATLGAYILTLAGIATIGVFQGQSGYAFVYFPLVIVYVAVAGLPIAMSLWFIVIRLSRWTDRRAHAGTVLTATVVALTLVLGLSAVALDPALAARRGSDGRRAGEPPVVRLLGRTTLSWSISNCSRWSHAVAVTDRSVLGEMHVARSEAAPFAMTRGASVVEPGWLLTLQVEQAETVLPPAARAPKIIARDIPGGVVDLRMEIGVEGGVSTSVFVDGAQRTHAVPLCPTAMGSGRPGRTAGGRPDADDTRVADLVRQ